MRLEQFHRCERKRRVVVERSRNQAWRQQGLVRKRLIFIMGAREWQRPALADETHIGQRLLGGDPAHLPFDDEHEIEVAVADLADRPGGRRSAEPGRDRGKPREVIAQIRLAENAVIALPGGQRGSV